MKKTNILLLTLVILTIVGIANATPIIHSVSINDTDNFYSNNTGNNIINIIANVSGVDLATPGNFIIANFSGVGNESLGIIINCSGFGSTINMTNETYGGDIYNASCDVGDEAAISNFNGGAIVIVAGNITNQTFNTSAFAVLYNMTLPPSDPAGCMEFGPKTTNFSKELDFENVNFTIEAKINLSCQLNTTIPGIAWANDFETLAILNFESLNFTDLSTINTLSQLPNALMIDISLPGEFGDSEIYLNSSLISSLNTTSTINLFHLPFTSQPFILEEVIGGLNTTGTWFQGVGEGNLTFTVNHFSGYNITDNSTPLINIASPINGLNTSSNNISINVSINGTGTRISLVNISIDGMQIGNLSNCSNTTPTFESFNCAFTADITPFSNATHNLTIYAQDFGSVVGNNATSIIQFAKDQTAPITTVSGNSSGFVNTDVTLTFIATDSLSGVNATYVNGNKTNTTTTISAEGETTITFFSTDNLGNNESNKTVVVRIDKTAPVISSFTLTKTGTIFVGDSLTVSDFSCTANDGTKQITGLSTTSSGTKTATCTYSDTAGNLDTETVSYTVTAASSSNTGGSSTTTTTTEPTLITQTTTLSNIPVNISTNFEFTKSGLLVENVELVLSTQESNAKIIITNLNTRPNSTPTVSSQQKDFSSIYKYLEVSHPSIENSHIKIAKIEFKVEKTWMTSNKYKKEQVTLYRYYNSEWRELLTKSIRNDSKYYYFEATSTGLSYFAIGVKKESAITVPEKIENTTTKNVTANSTTGIAIANTNTTTNATQTEIAEKTEKSGKGIIWFFAIVLIAGGIIALYYQRSRSHVVIVRAGHKHIPIKVTSKDEYEEEHPKNEQS